MIPMSDYYSSLLVYSSELIICAYLFIQAQNYEINSLCTIHNIAFCELTFAHYNTHSLPFSFLLINSHNNKEK